MWQTALGVVSYFVARYCTKFTVTTVLLVVLQRFFNYLHGGQKTKKRKNIKCAFNLYVQLCYNQLISAYVQDCEIASRTETSALSCEHNIGSS